MHIRDLNKAHEKEGEEAVTENEQTHSHSHTSKEGIPQRRRITVQQSIPPGNWIFKRQILSIIQCCVFIWDFRKWYGISFMMGMGMIP